MAIISPSSNLFIPDSWTLHKKFDQEALPEVIDTQKKRADKLLEESMPVIGKSNRYYGQIKIETIFSKLKEYSSEIEISGKTAYYIGGKELAIETAKKLKVDTLPFSPEPVRDLDIRIFVKKLDQYNSFIDFIHSLFSRKEKSEIINDLFLASHSDPDSISFTFGDKNSLSCDILFVLNPKRLHLFYRDAFRYSLKENKFVSDLDRPLQALSDYYYNVIQTDNPEAINKKGWPKLIVAKAKGAHIPDPSLEETLFDNVIKSKKRKEIDLEIIDLLSKAGKKAAIEFEELLYCAAEVLEKKLEPSKFKSLFSKTNGKIKEAVLRNIPFRAIRSYLQLTQQKNGEPDIECLFETPFKKELETIFNGGPCEEKLVPFLFRQKKPREAWNKIKSKALAEKHFHLLVDHEPLLAKEALEEFSLPYAEIVLKALLKQGKILEADDLHDKINDPALIESLLISLIQFAPTKATFEQLLQRSGNAISIRFARESLEVLSLSDIVDLSSQLLPFCKDELLEKLEPFFEETDLKTLESCCDEIKKTGIKKLIKKEISHPRHKEWRKLIDYMEDEEIESLFWAILKTLPLNEARLYCLHPRVSALAGQQERVKALALKANLAERSLYWDILDLCLSFNLNEAERLILHSRGNTSGLPKTVLKKMSDQRDRLLEEASKVFDLAECLNDLSIEPVSLLSKIKTDGFHSLALLKGGWLGKEPFDLDLSCYFANHSHFEIFYPHLSNRLHPLTPINERIDSLIIEKKFSFLATITNNSNASIVLLKLRAHQAKERVELLKKYGNETEWKFYLEEPEKKSEEIYGYLLSKPFSKEIKALCLEQSLSKWELYFSHPEALSLDDLSAAYRILFKKGLEKNKPYADLKKLSGPIDLLDLSIKTLWEKRQFIEEAYDLERALSQPPDTETLDILADKIYTDLPPKEDYKRLQPWLEKAKLEKRLEIQLYFDPAKTVEDILLIRPDMKLFEKLFLRLIDIKAFRYLKDIYIQLSKELRIKHSRAFIMNAIRDLDSQEFALREFKNIPCADREFELNFIIALFGEKSPLDTCSPNHFYPLWIKVSKLISDRSRERSASIPACKFEWEDEEDFIKGHLNIDNHRAVKKLLQQDLKLKKAEVIHVCKAELIPIQKVLERRFDHEPILIQIASQLKKLIPYHNLMTGALDEALFDFASLVTPSLENVLHKELCKELIDCMENNRYSHHYPTSIMALKLLIEGLSSNCIELNHIAYRLCEISKMAIQPFKIDADEFNKLETKLEMHIPAIFKVFKKLTEYDTFHTHLRAWLIISNIQISLIQLNRIDWIVKFYQQVFAYLPKYAFSEIRENFYLIILIKGLIADLIKLGSDHQENPILIRLIPEYIETLLKALKNCPEPVKQSFIADIMSLTLQYSNVKINLIFDKLIDYVEKIVELTFNYAGIVQIEMFTQGISEALTEFVKETRIKETEKERLKACMDKFKKALEANSHFHSLQNLMIQWSFHEKTLNIIKPQV